MDESTFICISSWVVPFFVTAAMRFFATYWGVRPVRLGLSPTYTKTLSRLKSSSNCGMASLGQR
jgi:hypothetical protein